MTKNDINKITKEINFHRLKSIKYTDIRIKRYYKHEFLEQRWGAMMVSTI
jgi:hypothetical protein